MSRRHILIRNNRWDDHHHDGNEYGNLDYDHNDLDYHDESSLMTLTIIMTLMIKGIRSNRWDEHDDQDSCRWECDNCDDLTDLEQNNQFLLPYPSYSELKKN